MFRRVMEFADKRGYKSIYLEASPIQEFDLKHRHIRLARRLPKFIERLSN